MISLNLPRNITRRTLRACHDTLSELESNGKEVFGIDEASSIRNEDSLTALGRSCIIRQCPTPRQAFAAGLSWDPGEGLPIQLKDRLPDHPEASYELRAFLQAPRETEEYQLHQLRVVNYRLTSKTRDTTPRLIPRFNNDNACRSSVAEVSTNGARSLLAPHFSSWISWGMNHVPLQSTSCIKKSRDC